MTADIAATLESHKQGEALMAALRSEAAGYYRILAALDHRDEQFIRGWLNRAYA